MPDQRPPPPDDQPEIPPAPAWDDPEPPDSAGASGRGRRIAGLPVWAVGAVAGAIVVALVIVLIVALSGGDGDDPAPAAVTPPAVTAPDTAAGPAATTTAPPQTDRLDDLPTDEDFASSIARPMDLLGASATAVGSTLAGTSGPGDLARVNRVAQRQAAVVGGARLQIGALPNPGRTDHAEALQALATATGHHRRYLDQLARAGAGTPSQAHLTVLSRARASAAQALAAYRRFFALAPGVPDTITSVGLADTAPVRSAIETSIARQEAQRREAERQRNEGRGDVIPDDAGFQSPTGNLRCEYRSDQLFCSSSNDSFGVVLPESGPPVTARGTAAGGATLAYGSIWSRGAFSCQSLTNGLSCENSSGNGFHLSRESYNAW